MAASAMLQTIKGKIPANARNRRRRDRSGISRIDDRLPKVGATLLWVTLLVEFLGLTEARRN
ncbi:hypothetical protein NRB_01890 [Novosphingobium sp. 11B]